MIHLPIPKIIFEDQNILVINKPAHFTVFPHKIHSRNSITAWINTVYPHAHTFPCHRLDFGTSGILICAKNTHTKTLIKNKFINKRIQKTYWTITEKTSQKTLCLHSLKKKHINKNLISIKSTNGYPSASSWKPIHFNPYYNWHLMQCTLFSGKPFQIRSHLHAEFNPINYDKIYHHISPHTSNFNHFFCKFFLHAYSISFSITNKYYTFYAPLHCLELLNFNSSIILR